MQTSIFDISTNEQDLYISYTSTEKGKQGYASPMQAMRHQVTSIKVAIGSISSRMSERHYEALMSYLDRSYNSGKSYRAAIEDMIDAYCSDR